MFKKLINRIFIKFSTIKSSNQNPWEIYKKNLKIHPSVILDPAASIKFFNLPKKTHVSLKIGQDSHIFSHFNFLRPDATISVGKRCQIGSVDFVAAQEINVGDDCIMAWGITIIDTDTHSLDWENRKNDVKQCYQDYLTDRNNFIKNKDWSHVVNKSINIGDKVWVGLNVIVLKGVTIGDNSVIGAGSVVTKNIPPYSLIAGNPAKVIKSLRKKKNG